MKGRPKAIVSEFPDRTAARAVSGWKPSAETIGTTNAILKSAATSGVSMSSGFSSLMKSARRQVLPKLRVLLSVPCGCVFKLAKRLRSRCAGNNYLHSAERSPINQHKANT